MSETDTPPRPQWCTLNSVNGPALPSILPRQRTDSRGFWGFSSANEDKVQSKHFVVLLCALSLHGALALVRTTDLLPVQSLRPSLLETFTAVDTVEEPEKLSESALEKPPVVQEQVRLPTSQELPHTSTLPSEGDPSAEVDTALVDGPPADELAAALLTDASGSSGWEMLSGQGNALGRGRLGRPSSGAAQSGRATSLSARNLSRNAIAPHLAPLVARNYPIAAKIARVSGTVTVSAIIQASGNPTDIRVVSANPRGRGFGETCSRTVHEGPLWKPRLNRDGRPVASQVRYTCHFLAPAGIAPELKEQANGVGANRVFTRPSGG